MNEDINQANGLCMNMVAKWIQDVKEVLGCEVERDLYESGSERHQVCEYTDI